MALYSFATVTTNITIGNAAWEIRTSSSDRARLLEFRYSKGATLTGTTRWGLGRPAAIGITPTSPITFLAEDPADPAGTVQSALAWGTSPTAPVNFFKRDTMFHAKDHFVRWTWPKGIVIPVSSSIVMWNITASTVIDVHALVDE